jgi:hypothetical protein
LGVTRTLENMMSGNLLTKMVGKKFTVVKKTGKACAITLVIDVNEHHVALTQ